jgi:nanoRNase/pAp phosphatase (c-di-AMP/oligoRNAs hydrolase)
MMTPDEVNFVIYHNPCSDGTGSAWAAWKYLTKEHPEREVIYFPTNHGRDPPDVTGKNVLISDFSYPKPLLDKMIKQANKLLIIDHHKTAQEALEGIQDEFKIFDMNHSGAFLTWKFFFPDDKVPLMIEYIQDRDIWTNKLPLTNEYASWFFTLDHDIEVYDKYSDDALFEEMLKTKGVTMLEKDKIYIEQAVSHATVKFQKINKRRFFVGYVNNTASEIRSDVGHDVVTHFKYCDFAAVYSISDKTDSTSFSLRSTDNNYDCSYVAKSLSGGGHRNAAGIRIAYVSSVLPGQVLDNNRLYWNLENIYLHELHIKDSKETINIVYCQSNIHRYDLGAYLLQDKYTDKTVGQVIQECVAITRIRDKTPTMYTRVQIAAMWSFDAINKITSYKIVTDPSLNKQQTEELIGNFSKTTGLEDIINISLPGLVERFT